MLIINAGGQPRRSERRLRDACRDLSGVLVLNALIDGGGGRTREIDGVLITPHRAYTIEVKGTKLSGPVTTASNKGWTVGGTDADFYGGPNPTRQARVAAQTFASMLRNHNANLGFVQSVVAVAGTNVTLEASLVGDTWAVNVDQLGDALTDDSPKLLSAEQVQQGCRVAGVDTTLEELEAEGFPRAGSSAHWQHRHDQARDRATDRVADAFAPLPGFLVDVPGGTANRGPDVQKVAVTPTGVYLIRVKSTTLRGHVTLGEEEWSIGGKQLYGKQHPSVGAHKAATWLRHLLKDNDVPVRVHPVVALCGTDLEVPVQRDTSAWVCRVEDLAGVFLRQGDSPLPLDIAAAVLEVLKAPVPRAALVAAGFRSPAPKAEGDVKPSRQRRREDRLAFFSEKARDEWSSSSQRRTLGSLVAAMVMFVSVGHLPAGSLVAGLVTLLAVGSYQLWRRASRLSVLRGVAAFSEWLLSLVPAVGVAAHLAAMVAQEPAAGASRPVLVLLHLTTALLLASLTLTGRNGYWTEPGTVYERYDEQGRPTGAYRISARPPHTRGSVWKPASCDVAPSDS